MAENETTDENQSIDYGASQAEIDQAKQASHEADRERLAEESKAD